MQMENRFSSDFLVVAKTKALESINTIVDTVADEDEKTQTGKKSRLETKLLELQQVRFCLFRLVHK